MLFENVQPKTQFESYAVPLFMALGALIGTFLYFYLPFEVSVPFFLLLSIVSLVISYFTRFYFKVFLIFVLFSSSCVFLTNTAYVVQNKETVFLPRKYEQGRHWVVGQIAKSATYDGRDKVTLENVKIYGVDETLTPKKIRISSSEGRLSDFFVGDWISLEAKLFSPKAQSFEEDFNLRQYYWMHEIGATGFVMGSIYKTSWPEGFKHNSYWLQKLRTNISSKVVYKNETDEVGESESVLVALLAGKRTYLTEEIYNAYRSSGLAHLLAISGLHIGLVAGFVFFGLRKVLAFSPFLALNYNLKMPAAILAVFACLFYTAIAGATLPTLRAFLMVSFIFFALLLGRLHNTLRILMLTLILVLFIWPESIITASFQMSFVAVFALTLFNEIKEKEVRSKIKIIQGMTYTKGVFLTSLVAGAATMPVAAWHFGEIHFAGFIVNVLAIPVTGFVVMPFAFLGLLFMPFGLHSLFFKVALYGVDILNDIAYLGSALPYGHFVVEKSEVVYLSMACFLFISSLYFKRFCKLSFALLTSVSIWITYASVPVADIIWLQNGKTILLGKAGDGYYVFKQDGSVGEKHIFEHYKAHETGYEKHFPCDSVGCVVERNNHKVLLLHAGVEPSLEDCQIASMVIGDESFNGTCKTFFKNNEGAVAQKIFLSKGSMKYQTFTPSTLRIWDE
ncbi:MAG: hypothetical protein CMF61_01740 [Magnetococcales bacterium]|nr:hypothetical protein [Magnetococcales bacterium]